MVITDKFVYIHMPKTGGTFVERALSRLLSRRGELYLDTSRDDHRELLGSRNQHERIAEIPDAHKTKKVLFTVRNPYDHYVSFYEFGWWKTHPTDTFDEQGIRRVLPHYPEITFREYIEAVNRLELLHADYVDPGTRRIMENASCGPLTLDYLRFLFPDPDRIIENLRYRVEGRADLDRVRDIHFLGTGNLNRELHDFLVAMGYEPGQLEFILELGKINPPGSRRREGVDWESYYSPELKRLVRDKERWIFSAFPDFDR